jgi:hypothetical protein
MSKMTALKQQLERSNPQPEAVKAQTSANTAPPPAVTRAPSRDGKVHVGAYLAPGFKSSLRLVQAQTNKDVQSLVAEALNELFHKYQVPQVDHN